MPVSSAALPSSRPNRGLALAPPTEAELRAGVQRYLGLDATTQLWERASRAVGVRRSGGPLAPEELRPLVDRLLEEDGIARVVAQAFSIRLKTHTALRGRVA